MAENIVDQILDAARTAGEDTLDAAQQRFDTDMQAGRATLERDLEELRRRGRRQAEEASQQELSTPASSNGAGWPTENAGCSTRSTSRHGSR